MADRIGPFFCFFGGKWRAAKHYPNPDHDLIIEPFAGAAGYSCLHYTRRIHLVDIDPLISALWRYLITVPQAEIRRIPINIDSVDDLLGFPQETKWLVGFWLNKGTSAPSKTPSKWMRNLRLTGGVAGNFWGERVRDRIAENVEHIRHWKVARASYADIPNVSATYFVDPPYQVAGKNYRYSDINFSDLSAWCQNRFGQVIVCEAAGSNWLPFQPFRSIKANASARGGKVSHEVIWAIRR